MATIIQPYNPWRENLAAGLLAPVINNMLQNSQQAAKNAKTAAFIGELNRTNDIPAVSSGIGGDAWVNSYFGGGSSGVGNSGMFGGLTGGGLPQGMNNGLTQFGNGIDQWLQAGSNAVNYRTPAVNNGPSLAKAMQVYGSDPQRWRSLSLDEITKAVTPYIEDANAARRRSAVDAVFQNPNITPEERVLALANLASNGDMTQGAFDSIVPQIHMTPQQRAQNEQREREFNEDMRRWNATFGANQAQNNERNRQWWAQFNKINPQMIPGSDGTAYLWGGGNNVTPLTLPDGTPLNVGVQEKNGGGVNGFNFIEQYMLNWADQRVKTIEEQIAGLNEKIFLAKEPDEIASLESQKSALQNELGQVEQQRNAILAPYFSNQPENSGNSGVDGFKVGNTGNIGFDVAGGRGYVTGSYGDDRGDHSHQGTDIGGLGEGAPLGVPMVQGVNNFTISDVGSSPKGGNYISMSGTSANGTRVDVIYRHLQDGSTRVKKGQAVGGNDVVAAVGNTGSSSRGAHLHIETKINGEHVDPRNFYKEFEKAESKAGFKANVNSKAGNSNAYNSAVTPYGTPRVNQVNKQTSSPTTQSPQVPAVQTTPASADDLTAWNVGQYFGRAPSVLDQFTQTILESPDVPPEAVEGINARLNGGNTAVNAFNAEIMGDIRPNARETVQTDTNNQVFRELTQQEYDAYLKAVMAGKYINEGIRTEEDLRRYLEQNGIKAPYITRTGEF